MNIIFNDPSTSIFNFSTFISALALLSVIYNITDIKFRFRIAIAPIPLHSITFWVMLLIGTLTLLSDLWFAKKWPILSILNDQYVNQSILGFSFLGIVFTWIYFAVINPPVFNRYNYKKFANLLFHIVLKGSENELQIIANELGRSAESLILSASLKNTKKSESENYAYELLLLLANRKFCRHLISSSPSTAILLFQTMSNNKIYDLHLKQLSRNISSEALINKDSLLYHEDESYKSGLLGYIKPFSQSIYGDYYLVEGLAKYYGSPLDIDTDLISCWDSTQLKAYSRCVLITFKSYIESHAWPTHSYALYRAFNNITTSCESLHLINGNILENDISKRFHVAVEFSTDLIEILDNKKPHYTNTANSFYDHIANLIFQLVKSASLVQFPSEKCWGIQYIYLWDRIFNPTSKGLVWKIIHTKLRRLIYNELIRLKEYPNYMSAKILGLCLNVMGIRLAEKQFYHGEYALHKAVISWTTKNYLYIRQKNLQVAEACLLENIKYDEKTCRLIKIYTNPLQQQPTEDFLILLNN
ncbi:TPA: hypothetical protein JBI12_02650 [Legionella pneumophila]|nr:hypothetical protein [Legionella pneumophila]